MDGMDEIDRIDPYAEAKDPLGARMKDLYERPTRHFLPPRQYTILRIDGRAFHSFTRGLERPFDAGLLAALGETTAYLCREIAGAQLGYHQSDEISLLLALERDEAEPWFGGNLQKLASISSSLATAHFNSIYTHPTSSSLATFDSRAFSIADPVEVANYFLWRQQDARRNAISMVGQAHFSPRQLNGVSTRDLVLKLQEAGVDVAALPESFRFGQVAERVTVMKPVEYFDKRTQETVVTEPVERRVWELKPAPDFKGLEWLRERIPATLAPARPELSL